MLQTSSETELEQLTRRYLDLVYASALRQMNGDAGGAADVTQSVMLILIKKARAGAMPKECVMAGWLLNVTRYAVLQFKRTAARRAEHENAAAGPGESRPESPTLEFDVRRALDSAVLSLESVDREVVVRRFLRGENLAEVAAAVGMNENTAGRRVTRALEKLRKSLARMNVSAPLAVLTSVLLFEAGTKAPVACAAMPPAGSVTAKLANQIIWKMALRKSAAAVATATALLAIVASVIVAVVQFTPSSRQSTTGSGPSAIAPASPGPITIDVARVMDGTSQSLLQGLLAGLDQSRRKLQTIHVAATVTSRMYDPITNKWLDPRLTSGRAWTEAASPRRVRIEADVFQTQGIVGPGYKFGPVNSASFVESWDGTALRRLDGPPYSPASAQTWDSRSPLEGGEEELLGKNFSMQLPWDEESSQDSQGTHKTIDRDPLDPSVLAKMTLSARHVILADGQEAMELTVKIPDPRIFRTETFWFDAHRGYGLLGRLDTLGANGTVLRRMTRRIDQLVEAAPGVFYPSKAIWYWEQGGQPCFWEEFQATSVTANEQPPVGFFQIQFPHGISVMDYTGARGVPRQN